MINTKGIINATRVASHIDNSVDICCFLDCKGNNKLHKILYIMEKIKDELEKVKGILDEVLSKMGSPGIKEGDWVYDKVNRDYLYVSLVKKDGVEYSQVVYEEKYHETKGFRVRLLDILKVVPFSEVSPYIIEKAKERYPSGTRFITKAGYKFIATGDFREYSDNSIMNIGGGLVYERGKWAELVKERESGYYWGLAGNRWEIIRYDKDKRGFYMIGYTSTFEESAFKAIDDKKIEG